MAFHRGNLRRVSELAQMPAERPPGYAHREAVRRAAHQCS